MKTTYFTVGPAQLYPTYAEHMMHAIDEQIGSISHRSAKFREIYKHTDQQLRILMNIPETHAILFASSATEIWERMIQNTVQHKSCHFVSGAFGKKFCDFSNGLGKQTQIFTSKHGEGFEGITHYTIDDDAELICTTQNETSSGVQILPSDLIALKKKYPNKLLCTDIVSSAPYPNIDFTYVDSAFFSVQKAFGLPAGLGVWIVNEACINKSAMLGQCGVHNTLEQYAKNYESFETPSTPNTLGIYLLGKIAEDMNDHGLKHIRLMMEQRAATLYQITTQVLQPLVVDHAARSVSTIVFNSTRNAKEWNNILAPYGLVVASGYGKYKDEQIRVANFPAIEELAFTQLVKALEQH
jgi:phosphoserine aminotransferase